MTGKTVVAYSEDRELGLQMLSKGREISDKLGAELSALLIGEGITDPEDYITHGADRVLIVDDPALGSFAVETYRGAVLDALKDVDLEVLLIGEAWKGACSKGGCRPRHRVHDRVLRPRCRRGGQASG